MTKKNAITQIFFFFKSHLEKKKINVYTKKKKKATYWTNKLMCKYKWTFLSYIYQTPPTQFSPHFGERTFWWAQRDNTWTPLSFSSLPLPAKHSPKSSCCCWFFFLSSSFILPKIHSTKHTLKGWSSVGFKTPSQYFRVRGHFNGIPLRNYIVWDERLYTPVQIVKCLKSFRHPTLTKKTINKILLEDKTWLNDGCNLHKVN